MCIRDRLSAADHPHFLAFQGKKHREHLRGVAGYEENWTDEQVGLWFALIRSTIESWDNNHFQYTSGFMTEDAWSGYEGRIRSGCAMDGNARPIVLNHPEFLRESFVEYCRNVLD